MLVEVTNEPAAQLLDAVVLEDNDADPSAVGHFELEIHEDLVLLQVVLVEVAVVEAEVHDLVANVVAAPVVVVVGPVHLVGMVVPAVVVVVVPVAVGSLLAVLSVPSPVRRVSTHRTGMFPVWLLRVLLASFALEEKFLLLVVKVAAELHVGGGQVGGSRSAADSLLARSSLVASASVSVGIGSTTTSGNSLRKLSLRLLVRCRFAASRHLVDVTASRVLVGMATVVIEVAAVVARTSLLVHHLLRVMASNAAGHLIVVVALAARDIPIVVVASVEVILLTDPVSTVSVGAIVSSIGACRALVELLVVAPVPIGRLLLVGAGRLCRWGGIVAGAQGRTV